jgi:hypothetical protein
MSYDIRVFSLLTKDLKCFVASDEDQPPTSGLDPYSFFLFFKFLFRYYCVVVFRPQDG